MARMESRALYGNLPRDDISIKTVDVLELLCVFELGIRMSIQPCKILPQIVIPNPLSGRAHLAFCEINPSPT